MFFVYLFVLFVVSIYQLCNEMGSGPEWVGGWTDVWLEPNFFLLSFKFKKCL